ncbi:MAG: hypothetical protein PVH88_16665 [Ignavibacteria bacterium]|jgi:hypothetical protein
MVKKLLFILILLISFNSLKAQFVEVYAETDTTDYYVGDYIYYSVSLKYDNNINIFFPSLKDTLDELEYIKEFPPVRSEGDKIQEIYKFVFSKYDSSKVTIPEIPIEYTIGNDTARFRITTNPVTLVVHTLELEPEADIKDVKFPITIPFDWLIAIIVLTVLLVLAAVGYYLYMRYKKKQAGKEAVIPKIVVPPDKIAVKKLHDLKDKKLWQQNLIKEYHSEITEIIREYFEKRFNILALEMPSSELLEKLTLNNEAQPIFDTTKEFLSNADMVKFAKFKPMPSINEEMMNQAFEIVKKTIKKEIEEKVTEEAASV